MKINNLYKSLNFKMKTINLYKIVIRIKHLIFNVYKTHKI